MVRPHQFRQAIIDLWTLGETPAAISKKLRVPRQTIHRTISRYKTLGTTKDRARMGRPKTAVILKNKKIVQKRVARNPKRSMRKMARALGISEGSVRNIVHSELKSHPYKMRKGHGLTAVHKEKRLKRCKMLMKRAVHAEHLSTVYSDEKVFTVEAVYNSQNTRIIAQSSQQANARGRTVSRVSHPQSVMVWAGVCATGKTPLVFVEPGAKVNKHYYVKEILEKTLLPWSQSHFKGRHWTFQQDSAPAHSAKLTQDWCAAHLPDFIPSNEWPSNSPDLNPLDFSVWSVLERDACSTRHQNLDSLKKSLRKAWEKIDTKYLRSVIDSVPSRLKDVIKANGGQIE